jgi:hypothetical protein
MIDGSCVGSIPAQQTKVESVYLLEEQIQPFKTSNRRAMVFAGSIIGSTAVF